MQRKRDNNIATNGIATATFDKKRNDMHESAESRGNDIPLLARSLRGGSGISVSILPLDPREKDVEEVLFKRNTPQVNLGGNRV